MKILNTLFLLFCFQILTAQVAETAPPEYIRSIEFKGQDEFGGTPIVELGSTIQLSFDDLIGDNADYFYKLEHFNFDWTPSELAKTEILNGFDDTRILNFEDSFNTLQIYTHYELQIPNNITKGLKVSGNYLLSILNSQREVVFSRKFMVYEYIALVKAEVKRTRNLKYVNEKQVLNFTINGQDDILIQNPAANLKTLIIPNNNTKRAIYNLKPQYTLGNELIYRYDDESAFWGGNEFLFFENKDIRASTMNIQRTALIDIYNTYLFGDKVRKYDPYTYNPDIHGHFKINTIQGNNPDIEAEYTWVHFKLFNYEPLNGGEIHLYGNFNNYQLDNSTRLTYDKKQDAYTLKYLMKQGFYNYKYVLKNKDGSIDLGYFSGNFDETENQYTILVYYRPIGGRFDRIIGVGSANSRNISN